MQQKSLIESELYYNKRLAAVKDDGRNFIIKPMEFPLKELCFTICSFLVLGGIATFFTFKYAPPDDAVIKKLIPLILAIILTVVNIIWVHVVWEKEQSKGIRFIFDKHKQTIELPRHNVKLNYSPNIYLQIATGWVGASGDKCKVSELQLIDKSLKRGARRWCILTSASSFTNAFDYILDDLYNETHMKIRGGKKKWN